MTQSKRMAVLGFNLFVFCALREAEAQSSAELIQSARTEEKANLTPWAPDKAERVTENIQNSLPYRLLTGEARGRGV
jgi:hypothetical protein